MRHREPVTPKQPASPPAPPSEEDPPALPYLLKRAPLFLFALILTAVAACGDDDDVGSQSTPSVVGSPTATLESLDRPPTQLELPISVAVTLPLFEDFVREVGLDNIEVFSLVPPGVDPHTYQLTEADIARLAGVDFFFVNGAGLDSHLMATIEANRDEDAFVIPFAPNIRSPQGNGLYAEEAGDNAHLWLDPDLADVYPETIADTFVIYDGVNEAFYNGNWQAMREEFRTFHEEGLERLATVPEANRWLFTYHDAFPHFARAFDFAVMGFETTAPAAGESPDVSTLAATVSESGVPAIFAEHGYDTSVMQQVASEADVMLCTLYTDILGDGMTTYLEMMRANVSELVRCLGAS